MDRNREYFRQRQGIILIIHTVWFVVYGHKKITNHQLLVTNLFVFKALYAQPIFDHDFEKNMPTFKTPDKNFFVANLDMTYPYDRGTNYAVKLGKQVARLI